MPSTFDLTEHWERNDAPGVGIGIGIGMSGGGFDAADRVGALASQSNAASFYNATGGGGGGSTPTNAAYHAPTSFFSTSSSPTPDRKAGVTHQRAPHQQRQHSPTSHNGTASASATGTTLPIVTPHSRLGALAGASMVSSLSNLMAHSNSSAALSAGRSAADSQPQQQHTRQQQSQQHLHQQPLKPMSRSSISAESGFSDSVGMDMSSSSSSSAIRQTSFFDADSRVPSPAAHMQHSRNQYQHSHAGQFVPVEQRDRRADFASSASTPMRSSTPASSSASSTSYAPPPPRTPHTPMHNQLQIREHELLAAVRQREAAVKEALEVASQLQFLAPVIGGGDDDATTYVIACVLGRNEDFPSCFRYYSNKLIDSHRCCQISYILVQIVSFFKHAVSMSHTSSLSLF